MDETPSEDFVFINEEKCSENSKALVAFPWQKEVENSDSDNLAIEKQEKPFEVFNLKNISQINASCIEKKRYDHYTLPSPSEYKPIIRKTLMHETIIFNRRFGKLERVWRERGLPVDKESLYSAANKDAFDLNDIRKSLPSTSASQQSQPRRFLANCSMSEEWARIKSYAMSDGKASKKALDDILRNKIIKRKVDLALQKQQRSRLGVSSSEPEEKPDFDEHNEPGAVISNVAHCVIDFTEMFRDFKKEGKEENSDVSSTPVTEAPSNKPELHFVESFEWDSRRKWTTHFDFPDPPVPINSPVEKETLDKIHGPKLMHNQRAEMQQERVRFLEQSRTLSKFKALDAHRNVDSEDMDRSESEKPSELHFESCNFSERSYRMARNEKMIQVRRIRQFRSQISSGSMGLDEVVPE